MSTNQRPLRKLIAAARKAHTPSPMPSALEAPFGFATRVATRWGAARQPANRGDLWERFCWWGASVSVAVCLAAFTQHLLTPAPNAFDLMLDAPVEDAGIP